MKFNWLFVNLLLVLLFGLFFACSEDEPIVENQYLISYKKKIDLQSSTLQSLTAAFGKEDMASMIVHDIRIFSVVYNTTYFTQEITASGVVVCPQNYTGSLPIISAQRGTIFADSEAPSMAALVYGFEILASAGYIVVMPDMIGFGESSGILHPYYNKELSAQSPYDMIQAALELLPEEEYSHNGQLFLMGYSEGGYITTAMHQMLEQSPIEDLSLIASSTGAGSYNLNFVMNDIINRGTFGYPAYLAFIVESYRETNDWSEPLSDFINEPYASEIPGLLEGSLTGDEINSHLTENIQEMFNATLLQKIKNGEDNILTTAFSENSVHDWAPVTATRIFHSPEDEFIPIDDSEQTAIGMKALGGNVEFVSLGGGSHSEAAFDMVEESLVWFETLKE